ncbi:DUF6660 family protein [Dyadobacter arcticus]|uniref:Secreted protein n=1 Tax=Dyadobacter arcticus TaxID=1078754 RepID=A0ABX0UMK0_9BACT|nr:DUF6660 family protein [Dyadobacter arcticus]NIJ52845.1 hypothetical protein [Dyadobacter arcticus]
MIRTILILLAFYTIALSCIPCQDEALGELHDAASIQQHTSQEPVDLDLCSPFCVCTCCAGITLQQEMDSAPLLSNFSVFEEITFAYSSGANSGDLTSIWQPPRI